MDFKIDEILEDESDDHRLSLFEKELIDLINRYSIENFCDMPDFLLAEMVCNFIEAIGEPIKKTLDWYDCDKGNTDNFID